MSRNFNILFRSPLSYQYLANLETLHFHGRAAFNIDGMNWSPITSSRFRVKISLFKPFYHLHVKYDFSCRCIVCHTLNFFLKQLFLRCTDSDITLYIRFVLIVAFVQRYFVTVENCAEMFKWCISTDRKMFVRNWSFI